jgi:hypothetical protein
MSHINGRTPPVTYATVSHCWGTSKTPKLRSTNIKKFNDEGIHIETLPASYKEAIYYAMELNIAYLWVDCLCIIQDSSEDWLQQAALMNLVYGNCEVCIALLGAAENNGASFSQRSVNLLRPLHLSAQWDGQGVQDYYLVNEMSIQEITTSVLESRGWVVQETFLAPRVLYLGSTQVWFQCGQGVACETYPGWYPYLWNTTRQSEVESQESLHLVWESTVERYSRARFTFLSDRVIAFSGITNHFGERLDDEPFAGAWKSQLPKQLLWQVPQEYSAHRLRPLRAPTWSWMSVEGTVRFVHRPELAEKDSEKALCHLVNIDVESARTDDRTHILKGSIRLQGSLHQVKIREDRHATNLPVESTMASAPVRDHFGEKVTSARWFPDEKDEKKTLFITFQDSQEGDMSMVADPNVQDLNPEDAFCLPIMEWRQEGFPFTSGIVVERSEIKEGSFARIGMYETTGEEEKSWFPTSELQTITII